MRYPITFLLLGITALFAGVVTAQSDSNTMLLGGENTVFDTSESAFTNPLPLLSEAELLLFEEGDELFEQEFERPDGLGPIFHAVSCESCHIEDGRGRPPAFTGETGTGLLIRLAINEHTETGATTPDPIYGGQFQDEATGRTEAEGTIQITYTDITGQYADGTSYTLRAPSYNLINLNYGALDPDTTLSPRLANQMIGLGYFEAIPESTILAMADPNDANGDGISGRPNFVWDVVNNQLSLGLFGWKANQPNLIQQSAAAYNGDIGITSYFFSDQPCTDNQDNCLPDENGSRNRRPPRNQRDNRPPREGRGNRPPQNRRGNEQNNIAFAADDSAEVTIEDVELVTFYSSTLAVPAQRNADDPIVISGQALFQEANCNSCHVETIQTGEHDSIPALSNQTIHPYTDLLLHDMGEGLADGQDDFLATGSEWRTAPLWGLGLFEEVNGYAFYLHDGRARTIEEAILWHGGEAEASRDAFINMNAVERNALVAFLKSL